MSKETNNLYEFGEFRLDVEKCLLWRGDHLVSLAPKALELLCLLVKSRGEIVSKDEIFENVWAETFVEEGVLTQNIYTLRKTLGKSENGKQIIENIARRGYRLTIPVKNIQNEKPEIRLNGENGNSIEATGLNSREFVLATQTRTEIIEEFYDDEKFAPKRISGKIPFYKKRSTVFFSVGVFLIVLTAVFGYRFFRPRVWAYFHPPMENVEFQKLTDSGNVSHPALSPDGNFLAFVEKTSIFLKDINSGKAIKLDIPNVHEISRLRFSPDGNWIFFRNSFTGIKPANILQVSRFGGETKIVAEKTQFSFALSPDGKSIAFARKFPEQNKDILFIKNLENGDEREVLTRNFPETFFNRSSISWSPDGTKIAFITNAGAERSTKLFVADVASGEAEEVNTPKLRRFEDAAWLADSETLVVSASEIGNKFYLWKIVYPQGFVQRITNGLNSFSKISVSADGKKILALQTNETSNIWTASAEDLNNFRQITEGNSNNVGQTSIDWIEDEKILYSSFEEQKPLSNLWLINTSDNSRQPLTSNTEFHSDYAKATNDGKYIFFNSNRERLVNIWRMDATGENLTQITKDKDGLRLFPQPSPDGKFLYYLFRSREISSVKKLNLEENTEETFLEKKELTPAGFLSLSDDGKFLAFVNLHGEISDDEEEKNFQICVVSTENSNDVKCFNVKTFAPVARFDSESKAFDYLSFGESETKILRQSIEGGEPQTVLTLPNERVFNFAWSKDRKKLAVSRGKQTRDAVLLTGYE